MDDHDRGFIDGVVASLDVIAQFGEDTMFEELISTMGRDKGIIIKKIKKEGLPRTKEMAKRYYPKEWGQVK